MYIRIILVCLAAILKVVTAERVLNEYIRHYETLTFNTEEIHKDHQRAKRSTSKNRYLDLKFKAHGRNFHLRLRPDTTTFSSDAEFELQNGATIPLDTSHLFQGEIFGEKGSFVHGSIINKIFTGKIVTGRGTAYWVEHADKYFDDADFHTIMYSEDDVNDDPHRLKRSTDEEGTCGLSEQIQRQMKIVQNSAVEKPEDDDKNQSVEFDDDTEKRFSNDHNKYSDPSLHESAQDAKAHRAGQRKKRETVDVQACNLFMQSDTMLWDRMTKPKSEKGLEYTTDRALEEITSLFSTHVQGIRKIYEDTVFENYAKNLAYGGITFIVHRVKINQTERDCPQGPATPNNKFCDPNVDVSNFLNLNSMRDHDIFCLAYIFTYRDFIGGTLGLAWVASDSRASGGICERYKEYQENTRKIYKSLNTGIVTLINYGSPVPPKVSTLTFAHEVGHNFGSPHDSGSYCTPYSATPSDSNGNFIMFASATSGDRPNNSKFSPCSKDNITAVLEKVLSQKNGKKNCFVERRAAFCGNRIVEENEQCDCGFVEDCQEKCCHGRNDPSGNDCLRKNNVQCSPSEGPCCTHDCNYIHDDGFVCREESDCEKSSSCKGSQFGAVCPSSEPKTNMTYCNDNTQVCISGDCRSSICTKIGWEQCFLEAPEGDKNYDKGNLCFVSCQNPRAAAEERVCISTGDVEALGKTENKDLKGLLDDLGQESIKLKPGAPCNNFRGYCDVFQKCRDVDADGPLARLKKLLFNEETFNEIRDWIIEHWWAVLLMGIGLIVFMGIFIKVCAVHTPSSNPNKPAPRKLMTLRPSHRQRQQGPPPPYPGPSRGGPQQGYGKGRGPKRTAQYEMKPHKV